MTVSLRDSQLSFFDVSFLTENLFDADSPYRLFRQKILPALEAQRPQLSAMYCATNGRPAVDPVLVAGVMLLQFRADTGGQTYTFHILDYCGVAMESMSRG